MAAIVRDITIEQGGVLHDEFILKSNGVPIDLTGYHSTMIIVDNDGVVIHTSIDTGVNPEITVGTTDGKLTRKISAEVTKTIPKTAVSYDWELTPPSGAADTWKLYRGRCHVIVEGSRGS